MYSASLSSQYSQLAPDPLPPGPRVTNPAAPILRLLLRGFNVALAALSLLLIGEAIWMGQDYRHSGGMPPGPPPEPEASTLPAASPNAAPMLAGSILATLAASSAGAAFRRQLVAAFLQQAVASFPWSIYLLGVVGVYCLCTALCGLSGVKRDRRNNLAAYILLMALLMLAEAGATLLLLTDNGWRERIPDDPSGTWREALDALEGNPRMARLVAVGMLMVQVVALAAACWLHGIYTAAYEAWLDDREEQSERAREVLARAVVQTYAGGGTPWSSRLRNKYGLEASTIEATTNAARQVAALQNDRPFIV